MKLKRLKALALVLLAWTSMSQAGTVATRSGSAGMEVGLRIVEACAIHTGGAGGTSVDCLNGSPYSIQRPAAADKAGSAPVLTVAF